MLCNDRLHDVKKSVVLGERVGCWGKLGGGTNSNFDFRRRVGKKREDVTVDGPVVREDILV